MQEPLVCVVIPHLNQEEFLRRCLASLAAQSDPPPHEVIVVDNGSRRLPEEVCAEFGVRLASQATPGPGPARNAGVGLSRAPLLAFIDADCLADPEWLAALTKRLSDEGVMILGGDVRIARDDPARATRLEAYESVYAYRQQQYIEKQGFSGTGNLAMRREVFEAVGPFGGLQIAEDIDWGQRAGRLGYRITYAPEVRVHHPARRTMQELYRKWDRHIAHLYEPYRARPLGRLRWLAYSLAVGLSPLGELHRVLGSERVRGWRERWAALGVLLEIRFYRCRRMLALILGRDSIRMSGAWNRE